mgnify:CR=1 FL=1
MPKRRANGEGNIRKRKDGRWEGRYTVGHNPETGKAIIKNVLGKTQAEVNDRCQWDLAKLSPNEYYHYITTGEYPAGMLPLWVK